MVSQTSPLGCAPTRPSNVRDLSEPAIALHFVAVHPLRLFIGALLVAACSTATTAHETATPSVNLGSAQWTDLGRILSAADFGQPAGSIIGDPTGVLLPDGRIRLFVFVDGRGVWRAISTDATGTAFVMEGPCTLIPDAATNTMGTPWGEPRVVPISNGLRMFYMQDRGIASATSTDHITWRQERGLRITAAQAGVRATTTGTVIPTRDGGYRMYFSALRDTPADSATPMKSAVSRDQLSWTMEPGVRIGPGSLTLDYNATDPFVFANANGSVTAWFFVQIAAGSSFQGQGGVYAATSTDGLTFSSASRINIPGGNPNIIVRRDGTPMMYMSASDQGVPGIRVARGTP